MKRNFKKLERRSNCTTERKRNLEDSKAWVRQRNLHARALEIISMWLLSLAYLCMCRSQSGGAEGGFEEGLQGAHSNPA